MKYWKFLTALLLSLIMAAALTACMGSTPPTEEQRENRSSVADFFGGNGDDMEDALEKYGEINLSFDVNGKMYAPHLTFVGKNADGIEEMTLICVGGITEKDGVIYRCITMEDVANAEEGYVLFAPRPGKNLKLNVVAVSIPVSELENESVDDDDVTYTTDVPFNVHTWNLYTEKETHTTNVKTYTIKSGNPEWKTTFVKVEVKWRGETQDRYMLPYPNFWEDNADDNSGIVRLSANANTGMNAGATDLYVATKVKATKADSIIKNDGKNVIDLGSKVSLVIVTGRDFRAHLPEKFLSVLRPNGTTDKPAASVKK